MTTLSTSKMPEGTKILTFFMMVFGNSLGAHLEILERQKRRLQLQQVYSEDECDFVLAFVSVGSRIGTDIEAALGKILTDRPVLLVVLHNTFEPEQVVPNSKYCVNRNNVLAVDFLHYENTGLLQSQKNDTSSKEITDYLITLGASFMDTPAHSPRLNRIFFILKLFCGGLIILVCLTVMNKLQLHVMDMGNTKGSHKTFMDLLISSTSFKIVNLEKECDVIVAFVPVVSRAGTNIQEAMEKIPGNKQVVLVVLHHTFDPHMVAPDSRWCVDRDRVFAVDCLYHEDQGLLNCLRNEEAIKAVKKHLVAEENKVTSSVTWNQPECWNPQSCVQYMNNNVGIKHEIIIIVIFILFSVFLYYKLLH